MRTKGPSKTGSAVDTLEWQLRHIANMPWPTRELKFCEDRKFRFDIAYEPIKLAIEVDGGIWRRAGGAHTGTGHLRDMTKGNLAVKLGWRVLRFTPDDVKNGTALNFIEEMLKESK